MKKRTDVLERALALAERGQSWADLQAQLLKEGFPYSELHRLSSPILMRQLLAKMGTVNAQQT